MIEIRGKVIHGDHYGTTLGFPTANIDRGDYSRRKLKIKLGVWAGVGEAIGLQKKADQGPALQRTKRYKAAIVIGPIDKKGLPKIEAHLLNFTGNLYGKHLVVHLKQYIRPFKKFKSEQELKKQIADDIKYIKKLKI